MNHEPHPLVTHRLNVTPLGSFRGPFFFFFFDLPAPKSVRLLAELLDCVT